jgi:hypothetical protein
LLASQFATYQFATTRENFISAITETSDTALVYPGTGTQTASHNNLNPLANLPGHSLIHDANGNLSAGTRRTGWRASAVQDKPQEPYDCRAVLDTGVGPKGNFRRNDQTNESDEPTPATARREA